MTATVKRSPRKASAKNKEAEEGVENVYDAAADLVSDVTAPEPAPAVDEDRIPSHSYGDIEVYVYRPKDGSAPIVLPSISTVRPTQKFFWKLYPLNEMFQSFEWLNLAKVPRDVQERIMDLGERDVYEQADLFRGWFAPISRPQGGLTPPGES